jgi:hypothetical protein
LVSLIMARQIRHHFAVNINLVMERGERQIGIGCRGVGVAEIFLATPPPRVQPSVLFPWLRCFR